MEDNLGRIFKDRLFETKKDPNRDWGKIADRAGSELYEDVVRTFSHPEIALCAVVHCLSELILCCDKQKRPALIDRLKEAVRERVASFESEDGDEGEGHGRPHGTARTALHYE